MASVPSIAEFYAGRNLFVTGATGFMGKVLIEKILRACPAVANIYLLVRSKRGVSPQDRVDKILDCKLFEKLRHDCPDFREKVVPIVGDISEPGLGISPEDRALLIREVSIVFHSAATVRFDEVLRVAVQMNIVAVRQMITLAREMTKLEAFIHVSTAYANCHLNDIEERVYPTPLHPSKLIEAVSWMSDDVLNTLTPKLIEPRPNTYTYTKAMAEVVVQEEAADLPVAIVRPSIVGATWQDPFPGWVDNFNGPTGMFAAIGKGVLRQMLGNRDGIADVVPVDSATNMMIASAWYTAIQRPTSMQVYNCTTGGLNPLYWGEIDTGAMKIFRENPLNDIARLPYSHFTRSRVRRNIGLVVDHYLPAWIMDLAMKATGNKPMYTRMQDRLWKAVEVLEFFTSHEWRWTNDNVLRLIDSVSMEDKEIFDFDIRRVNWDQYLENYCLGTKQFALKEDLGTLVSARSNIARLHRRDRMLHTAFLLGTYWVLYKRSSTVQYASSLLYSWSVTQMQRLALRT